VALSARSAFAVWITGLPASGKSTVTAKLAQQLRDVGIKVAVLESDELRKLFSPQPRYDEQDREYFYGSLAFIGRVLTENGISVILDATANLRVYRDRARQQIPAFVEVFVDCPLDTCMRRDPKGIYRKAREGQVTNVPGLQAPYEPPLNADIVIHGDRDDPANAAQRIIEVLLRKGLIQD
jgi:adenylylsulfate kinase